MTNITISNILQVEPLILAQWVSENILDLRIPDHGINGTSDMNEIVLVMVKSTNRIAFINELYAMCIGAKAPWTIAKRSPDLKAQAETNVTTLTSSIDILYRTIQTLDSIRDTAGRLVTYANNISRTQC